jgi:hypothetical protein
MAAWGIVQAVPARLAEGATGTTRMGAGTTVCPWAVIVLRMA